MTMQIGKMTVAGVLLFVVSGCSTVSKWTPDWVGRVSNPFAGSESKASASPRSPSVPATDGQRPDVADTEMKSSGSGAAGTRDEAHSSTDAGAMAANPADQESPSVWKAQIMGVINRITGRGQTGQAPVSSQTAASRLIMPVDRLAIKVRDRDALSTRGRVNNAGEIEMPVLGPVLVAGLTPSQASEHISSLLSAKGMGKPLVELSVEQ